MNSLNTLINQIYTEKRTKNETKHIINRYNDDQKYIIEYILSLHDLTNNDNYYENNKEKLFLDFEYDVLGNQYNNGDELNDKYIDNQKKAILQTIINEIRSNIYISDNIMLYDKTIENYNELNGSVDKLYKLLLIDTYNDLELDKFIQDTLNNQQFYHLIKIVLIYNKIGSLEFYDTEYKKIWHKLYEFRNDKIYNIQKFLDKISSLSNHLLDKIESFINKYDLRNYNGKINDSIFRETDLNELIQFLQKNNFINYFNNSESRDYYVFSYLNFNDKLLLHLLEYFIIKLSKINKNNSM